MIVLFVIPPRDISALAIPRDDQCRNITWGQQFPMYKIRLGKGSRKKFPFFSGPTTKRGGGLGPDH